MKRSQERYDSTGVDQHPWDEELLRRFIAGEANLPEALLPELAEWAYMRAMAWRAEALDDPDADLSGVIELY